VIPPSAAPGLLESLPSARQTRRVALVSNLCPHYRKPLYETLATRFELDCFFFAESEPYWNPRLPARAEGRFHQVDMRRVHLFGEPILPGMARRVTRAQYDALVVGLAGRLMVPYMFALARGRGIPFVLWTGTWQHPRTPFHRVTQRWVNRLYRKADAIVVYGDHVRRALTAVDGVDDAKIFTAAQAVDGDAFAAAPDPARSRDFLFVGRFEEEKGVRDLVRAFGQVPDPGLTLSFVGSGSLEGELTSAAARDPRISIVGHVPHDRLAPHLARARCLVLPSVTTPTFAEPWGLVVNEAMHAGIPVITTSAVGAAAHGLVQPMATGIVVPERDSVALAAAIATLAADDDQVSSYGRAGRERVSGYTFDAMADAFESAVEWAISNHAHHA
jgi:glycosyltransferase involved in cell wall biosynthesis